MQYRISHFESLPSTSDQAAKPHYSSGDVVVADFQTQGRGQRGNSWMSERGENLLFSLVLEPQSEGVEVLVSQFFRLSEIAVLSVAATLHSFGVQGVELKWPNDVMVGGRKIAGILIENSITGAHVSRSIIGVGVNVAQREFSGILDSHPTPTSLAMEGVEGVSVAEVLRRFTSLFTRFLHTSPEELHAQYMERLYRREGCHNYECVATQERFSARIVGIDPGSGELTLQPAPPAQSRSYFFKEVKFL